MKLIIAFIKPSKLDDVIDALADAGTSGLTVTEARGYGRQQGKTEVYRGAEYEVRLVPKVRIEVAAEDAEAAKYVETIAKASNTGKIGDGKILVLDLQEAHRIRTGERDEQALK